MTTITSTMTALQHELEAAVGDDDQLRNAAGQVALWAACKDPHVWEPLSPVAACRRGLIGGRAEALELLAADAEWMEWMAAALRTLIAHTEATHPLARRRRRR